nr:hypothetical protein [Tanacetum cinerariifolium]
GLTLKREQPVEITDEFDVQRLCAERGVMYALCQSRQEPGNLLVVAYNVRDGRVHLQNFKTKLCRDIAAVRAVDGKLLATGLFTTDLTAAPANPADPRPALKFYDFRRLRHFFDYLGPGKEARLRDRTDRREADELSPLRWHYRLLLHELLPRADGGYTLVAEVYYPRYNYNNLSYAPALSNYSNLSVPYYTGAYSNVAGRAFVGIRTTHVLVCGFDRRGSLLWDNTYVVEHELLHDQLEEAIRTITLPDGRMVL